MKNRKTSPETAKKSVARRGAAESRPAKGAKVTLLSGGNPQITKGYGDASVQAYIAALPGWKRELGRRIDKLVVRTVPGVQKAVKWNSPFYGLEGQGWFLSFHCFTKYIKVTFFRGRSLSPFHPVSPDTRKCATSTFTRISWTNLNSHTG
jgi:hypothetical protein